MRNLLIIACLICLAVTAVPGAAAADQATVVVQPSARIEGSIVSLGEIARIETDRPDLAAQLREIPLSAAPVPQRTLSITINDIRDILAARGYDTSTIRVTGASRAEVRRSVVAAVEGDATDRGASPGAASQLPVAHAPNGHAAIAQVAASGPAIVDSQPLVGLMPTRGSQGRLPSSKGLPSKTLGSLAGDNTSEELALHTTRHVRRGEILRREDLELRPVTAVRREEYYPTDLTALVGKEMTHALAMDRPVAAEDVRQPILIRRNEIVTVISKAGNITVRREVVARGDAGQGDLLDVETLDPRRSGRTRHSNQFQVIVTGPGEAQVLADSIQAKPSDR